MTLRLAIATLATLAGAIAALFWAFVKVGGDFRERRLPTDDGLLRRLDAWHEGVNPGPLIRWAAAHLRGERVLPNVEPAPEERGWQW